MRRSNYIILFIAFVLTLFYSCDKLDISSEQAKTFVKLYGSYNTDIGNDVIKFSDGYLILATVNPNDENTEIVILQTDGYGNLKNNGVDTISSLRGGNNTGAKLLLTQDGGFIVLGTVEDTLNNHTDIYINKFSSGATSEWEKFIGTGDNEVAGSVKKAYDGYIIAGSTDSASKDNVKGVKDVYLVKIDDSGNIEWANSYGGSGEDYATDLVVIDNGYMIVGTTNSFDEPGQANDNIIVIKTNLYGGAPDKMTYGSTYNDNGAAIVKSSDGGYVIVGSVVDAAGVNSDMYVVKVEEEIHNIIWSKVYGTTGLNDQGFDIIQSNGGYVLVGTYELTSGQAAYFLKIDAEGEIIIENTFGGYGQTINAIEPTYDGGFIMTGSSGIPGNEMIYLIKVNSEGEL